MFLHRNQGGKLGSNLHFAYLNHNLQSVPNEWNNKLMYKGNSRNPVHLSWHNQTHQESRWRITIPPQNTVIQIRDLHAAIENESFQFTRWVVGPSDVLCGFTLDFSTVNSCYSATRLHSKAGHDVLHNEGSLHNLRMETSISRIES